MLVVLTIVVVAIVADSLVAIVVVGVSAVALAIVVSDSLSTKRQIDVLSHGLNTRIYARMWYYLMMIWKLESLNLSRLGSWVYGIQMVALLLILTPIQPSLMGREF